jgi:hypothetical protein
MLKGENEVTVLVVLVYGLEPLAAAVLLAFVHLPPLKCPIKQLFLVKEVNSIEEGHWNNGFNC